MPTRHAEDLFSGAYDQTLTDQQRSRLDEHLRECAECTRAFAHFQSSVDALRALPAARMPIPVHLPSTPPVAEQRPLARIRPGWMPRFRPGMATGLAAAAAAAIVAVALTHQGSPSSSSVASQGSAGGAGGPVRAAPAAVCPLPATTEAARVPSGFGQRTTATEPGRPGQQLVLATPSEQVRAGAQVPVYAVLTAPLAAAAPRSGAAGKAATIAAIPCLTVVPAHATSAGTSVTSGLPAAGAVQLIPLPALRTNSTPAQVLFTVPTGTAPGTVLQITATVPANYPDPGNPAMTVLLTITVD